MESTSFPPFVSGYPSSSMGLEAFARQRFQEVAAFKERWDGVSATQEAATGSLFARAAARPDAAARTRALASTASSVAAAATARTAATHDAPGGGAVGAASPMADTLDGSLRMTRLHGRGGGGGGGGEGADDEDEDAAARVTPGGRPVDPARTELELDGMDFSAPDSPLDDLLAAAPALRVLSLRRCRLSLTSLVNAPKVSYCLTLVAQYVKPTNPRVIIPTPPPIPFAALPVPVQCGL